MSQDDHSAILPPLAEAAQKKFIVVLQDLRGGGAERVAVLLANGMSRRGHQVCLALIRAEGPLSALVADSIRVVTAPSSRTLFSIPWLARLIRRERPDAVISHLTHVNVGAILAGLMSGSAGRTLVVEHNQISRNRRLRHGWAVRLAYRLVPPLYGLSGAIVAVSQGVADDLAIYARLPAERIRVIHNPVVSDELVERAAEKPDHPWFAPSELPVVLGIGRLHPQKNFGNLIRAFAKLRRSRPARLMILGEGDERPALEALVREFGLSSDVALPGFVENPYAYLAGSAVFALSSDWEGLPTVLIEALACGVPVVSTDCQSGPYDILEGGRHGRLVPVGDSAALALAIEETLASPGSREARQDRARDFTIEQAVQAYLDVAGAGAPAGTTAPQGGVRPAAGSHGTAA